MFLIFEYCYSLAMNIGKVHHYSSLALAALVPAGLLLAPSTLCMPIDLALAVAIPVHGYIGGKTVIEDYIPMSMQPAFLLLIAVLTILAFFGFLGLTISGPGNNIHKVSIFMNFIKEYRQE